MSTPEDPLKTFEANLKKLEAIVAKSEQNTQDLATLVSQFETGMALSQACQRALDVAEQKVEVILAKQQQASDDAS